ncbi:hypothetical protein HS121_15580 [bacterium]|nr:hypothetical protein [bacterium]
MSGQQNGINLTFADANRVTCAYVARDKEAGFRAWQTQTFRLCCLVGSMEFQADQIMVTDRAGKTIRSR